MSFKPEPQELLDIYISLLIAVVKARGGIYAFTPKQLRSMSAMELLETLAPNQVEFTYKGPAHVTIASQPPTQSQ